MKLATIAAVILAGVLLFRHLDSAEAARETPETLEIQLMTSLPIIWGEGASLGDILSDDTPPYPIYSYWQKRYKIEPVDSFENLQKSETDIVILAQPRAMAPADLADIDAWVRGGGRAIVMTDPALVWPSELPLGDNRRPLISGLLSPLLSHWGLELVVLEDMERAFVELDFGDLKIATAGVGAFRPLAAKTSARADCQFSSGNILADCKVGKGRAILIADADFLHENMWITDPLWQTEKRSQAMLMVDQMVRDLTEEEG